MLLVLLQNVVTSNADSLSYSIAANQPPVSYFELAVKGGWVMIPIALLSIIAVYIFIERFMAIAKCSQN